MSSKFYKALKIVVSFSMKNYVGLNTVDIYFFHSTCALWPKTNNIFSSVWGVLVEPEIF